ncbi:MAG: sulfatase/phosphatase domain-containing protein [Planctomycetota bacterium]
MVRSDRWKLIHYPKIGKYQLFDLAEDPHERNDRAGNPAHAGVQNRLRLRLEAWQHEIGDPLAPGD